MTSILVTGFVVWDILKSEGEPGKIVLAYQFRIPVPLFEALLHLSLSIMSSPTISRSTFFREYSQNSATRKSIRIPGKTYSPTWIRHALIVTNWSAAISVVGSDKSETIIWKRTQISSHRYGVSIYANPYTQNFIRSRRLFPFDTPLPLNGTISL
ncbi:hypothetical protein BJ138DRAFT_605411 [Hygrophoropsis aurantiaca]|uniref:Uncharacterized protein n=1 Tax=Hygrophoropsis aurantiaca TaxID=72124 RepID=A0ACB8AJW5_9AGAM|nr:hypothetical protein BJ138DRAFT_605411 [Hygrophoropsis aurantiaca]